MTNKNLLSQALDALEVNYSDYIYDGAGPAIAGAFESDIAAIRSALAAPQPEPVAWAMLRADGLVLDVICPDERESYRGAYTVPLYAAPPAAPAPAVPLTDKQIEACIHLVDEKFGLFAFARAIEQAHGTGGGGK